MLIASLLIYFSDGRFWYFDPLCTYVFGILVFYTTRITFKYCIQMLMEGCPNDVDLALLKQKLLKVRGVQEVHDLHVWSLSDGKFAMTCHLVKRGKADSEQMLEMSSLVCREQFKINHFSI